MASRPGRVAVNAGAGPPFELARLSAPEIAQLDKRSAVVVQPIGSVEQHGPHLPVLTDAYVAESVARGALSLLADGRPQVFVLPTISYGRSVEHQGFPGTVSLSTETLLGVCRDVGRSLAASGFTRLVFVDGHGGNVALLDVAARDIRAETGLLVFRVMPSHFGLPDGLECPDAEFAAHANFVETSVMLALDESMVHMDRVQPGGESATRLFGKPGIAAGGPIVPVGWLTRDLSGNGVIGDPRRASAEAGRRILDHWQRHLADRYQEIAAFEFGNRQ
jgi:creatinine amidohydrolase